MKKKKTYDLLLAQEKSLLEKIMVVKEEQMKVLPEKVKQIYKQVTNEGRNEFTDEEFQIIVLLEPWRRGSGRKDHC
jgi:hypothetical protein